MSGRRPLPIGAVYALAECETRAWWRIWGCDNFGGLDRAAHRNLVELPKAEAKLRELLALPKEMRQALANALLNAERYRPA